jgi:GH25 family lysozyme M1 (1,4-beta-N-acetylmuramidase)
MAVGYDGTSESTNSLAETFNGTSWTVSPSVNDSSDVNQLQSVSCTTSSFCIAVGYDANYLTVAETFNGSSWTLDPPQNPGATDGSNALLGVSCSSSSLCVAVGWFVTEVGPNWQTLAETWTAASSTGLPVLTITATSTSFVYGSSAPTITPIYSGFVNGDTASSLTTPPTCSTVATSTSPVSDSPYVSSCTSAVDPNYTFDYVNGTVDITPDPTSFSISIDGSTSATIAAGGTATLAETGLPATATGSVAITSGSTPLCVITLPSTSCPTPASLTAGSYDISGSFSDTDGNYADSTSSDSPSLTVLAGPSGTQGLDVYAGNGTINWTDVADAGYSFAYVQGTEGTSYTDSEFQADWSGMVSAGVTPGASLLLDGTLSGLDQANYFLGVVGSDYTSGDLVPAVDTSVLEAQLDGERAECGTGTEGIGSPCITVAQAQDVLNATVSALTSDFGVAPVIYTDSSFWSQIGDPAGYGADPLWLSDVSATTAPSGSSLPGGDWYGNGLTLWQYSFTGTVPSASGAVDLDQSIGALPVLACPLGSTSCASATSSSSDGTAVATDAGTTATASEGEGTINVDQYSSDPDGPLPNSTAEYFDVSLTGVSSTFNSVTIVDCNLNGGDALWWWNGSAWVEVSPQSASPPGCITADLSSTSTPTVSELTGTVFAVAAPTPVTVSVSGSMTYGGTPTLRYTESPTVSLSGTLTCTTVGGASPISSLGVGSYTVNGTSCSGLSAPSGYVITYSGTANGFVVATAPLIVTASSGSFTFGGSPPVITASYGGFVNGDSAASLTTPATCTTTATSHSPSGNYPSTCIGAVDSNYVISYVAGNVKVYGAATNVSIVALPLGPIAPKSPVLYLAVVTKGSVPGTLTGTVSFSENGTAIAGCSNLHVVFGLALCLTSFATVGSYAVVATYAGDPDFANSSTTLNQLVVLAPVITSANHTTASVGTPLSFEVTASGYPTPSFSENGALPKGVTLSSGGLFSGTPSSGTGGVYPITVTARNAYGASHQSFTLVVEQPPAITSTNKLTVTLGRFFSFQVTASGYPAASFSESGTLPKGLSLSSGGLLSGTAQSTGVYTITVTATNVEGSTQQNFTLTT